MSTKQLFTVDRLYKLITSVQNHVEVTLQTVFLSCRHHKEMSFIAVQMPSGQVEAHDSIESNQEDVEEEIIEDEDSETRRNASGSNFFVSPMDIGDGPQNSENPLRLKFTKSKDSQNYTEVKTNKEKRRERRANASNPLSTK